MIALWRFFTLGVLCLMTSTSTAFVARPWPKTNSLIRLQMSQDDEAARNRIRTDIRNFLTQRAIQSFVYLLISCRDPHTVRWLENTYDFKSLEHYHGTGAFNLAKFENWDTLLRDMLARPTDTVIVRNKGRRRGGGWRGHSNEGKSKNNPYLEDRYVDFEIEIDPPSLVSRIVSVRDQIAKEWCTDLDTFIKANRMILKSYHDKQGTERSDEECVEFDNPEDCIDTEQLIAPYSDRKSNVYDRHAMYLLDNTIVSAGGASSPNRKGNFDLMVLLATQESVHRVLREYAKIGDEREVSFEWLRQFYIDRIPTFFDGNQEYHRADDFMEELLTTPPSMKDMDGKVGLIDPLRIAEDIIAMRTKVAKDWKKVMKTVPKDHMELQRELLAIRMGKYDNNEDEQEEKEAATAETVSKEAKPTDTEVGSFE